jgi:rhodanese-related sulfurtransferase
MAPSAAGTAVRLVSPAEAKTLCEEGSVYVDVRSEPEFAEGHPASAYNVPYLHKGATGLVPNEEFLSVMAARFPKDQALVVGCRSGARSAKAAAALVAAGYTHVADQRAGFEGVRDPFGALTDPGWRPLGLPIATEPEPGRSYLELAGRAAR